MTCSYYCAFNKLRRPLVTTIDLKNAFGEVNHKLLKSVLEYHHLPNEIIKLILEFYHKYTISIGTKEFVTDPIDVGKGVLQGDA